MPRPSPHRILYLTVDNGCSYIAEMYEAGMLTSDDILWRFKYRLRKSGTDKLYK